LDRPIHLGKLRLQSHTIRLSERTAGRLAFEYKGWPWGDILLDEIRLARVADPFYDRDPTITRAPHADQPNETETLGKTRQVHGQAPSVDAGDDNRPSEPPMSLREIVLRLDDLCKKSLETQDALLRAQAEGENPAETRRMEDDQNTGQ
jgi:hypothetical protein